MRMNSRMRALLADSQLRSQPAPDVRFHKTRPGEKWLDGNLESYQEEAILEVSNQEPMLFTL